MASKVADVGWGQLCRVCQLILFTSARDDGHYQTAGLPMMDEEYYERQGIEFNDFLANTNGQVTYIGVFCCQLSAGVSIDLSTSTGRFKHSPTVFLDEIGLLRENCPLLV